ncbi:MAG: ATP-dependent DNA helicase UvrD2 [Actinomycetales bacterium]|nr:ATP-dependent DNA helicase UvrD2 [Actinomycetales bacterium]
MSTTSAPSGSAGITLGRRDRGVHAREVLSDADAVLAALDPEQREAATALSGPVCILAGAGTGKTRAITHRIAYGVHAGVYVPQHVLAVTFTARAAGELRSRLRDLAVAGVQARTFHAAALRQLGYFWPRVIGGAPPAILEHKAGLVADAATRLRLGVDRAAVRDLSAEIEWAKVGLLTPETYASAGVRAGRGEPGGLDVLTVARLMEVYEQVKTERGVIDFEDVLLLVAGIIEENAEVAAAVRAQYRHFVVDEYQDVSTLQQRVLDLWLGDRDDVCVVGDPSQTIYSFAGASPEHLLGFPRRFPTARVVRLVRDYRSTPQVVALANGLLTRAGRAASAAAAGLELVAQGESGPEPTLTVHPDDVAEAAGVAERIRGLLSAGVRASGIAVLFRTNAQSEPLEQALADAGIPYLVRGGVRFFARKEVRDAILLLRGAARASTGEETLGDEVRGVLATAGWTAEAPASGGAVRDRWESLAALAALADELAEKRQGARLADLVAELDERAAAQHAPTVEGVTLASLHAAKGLEWDAVFLVGLSEGLMPIALAEGWAAVEEERRLLYVGITRARRHLHLSWARARTPGGRAGRSPSRFLDGLIGDPVERRRGTGAAEGERRRGRRSTLPTRCRVCTGTLDSAAERKVGRCGSCPPDYDEELFENLRGWRSRVAAAAKLPAYCVFTDATLVAIAETVPRDEAALAALPGVGPAKLSRYGQEVLEVLGGSVAPGRAGEA